MLLTRRVDSHLSKKKKNKVEFHRKSSGKKECIVRKRNVEKKYEEERRETDGSEKIYS